MLQVPPLVFLHLSSTPSANAEVIDSPSTEKGCVHVTAYACTPAGVAASTAALMGAKTALVMVACLGTWTETTLAAGMARFCW
jgi:hypothetical protein